MAKGRPQRLTRRQTIACVLRDCHHSNKLDLIQPYFIIDNVQHQCDGSFGCPSQVFLLQERTYLLPILNLLEFKRTVYILVNVVIIYNEFIFCISESFTNWKKKNLRSIKELPLSPKRLGFSLHFHQGQSVPTHHECL